jgi:NAD+ kinase
MGRAGKAETLGIGAEIQQLNCAAIAVSTTEPGRRSDLLVSLGGDGTMLQAMRLADGQRALSSGSTSASSAFYRGRRA